MRRITIRNRMKIIFIISMAVFLISLSLIQHYSNTIKQFNGIVSQTIAITQNLDDIEKNYFAFFIQDMLDIDTQVEVNNSLDDIKDRIQVIRNTSGYEEVISDEEIMALNEGIGIIKTNLSESMTNVHPNSHQVKQVLLDINALKAENLSIRESYITYIRSVNKKLSIMNTFVIYYCIAIIIVFMIMMNHSLLKPIEKFKRSLENRLDKNLISPPLIENYSNNELGDLFVKYNLFTQKLKIIDDINQKIYEQNSFEEVVDYIFETCVPFIPYNRIGIAVISSDGEMISAIRAKANYPLLLGKNYTELLSETSLKDVIESNKMRTINDLEAYLKLHPNSNSTKLIIDEGMKSSLTIPLVLDEKVIGVIFFSSKTRNAFNESHEYFVDSISKAIAISFEKSFVYNDLLLASVKGFANIVESKDHVTGNHIDRMSNYSRFVAECLYNDGIYPENVNDVFIDQVFSFSSLHDIGKVGISESILNKPGKLTDEEFEIMKEHTLIGDKVLTNMSSGTILKQNPYFEMAGNIARHHHERFDGTGYPDGLKGNDISLCARIVAVADVFDALTNERPYKPAFSFEKTMSILIEGSGQHFDPLIIDSLIKHENELYHLYKSFKE